MSPTSGPVGTPVTIHLKGVGWTEYDNIYVATYDNAYMGYACGFNSQGDVVINFTAAGAPGVTSDRSVSRDLPGPADRAATALPSAAAHLRRRSSRQQDSGAALHVRSHGAEVDFKRVVVRPVGRVYDARAMRRSSPGSSQFR